MGFKLGSEKRQIRNSQTTPIFRKKMEEGVLGEANKDGSITINEKIKEGSKLEKEVIKHEQKHIDDMQNPKIALNYTDKYVSYKGKKYPRKNGKIKYNGTWHEEGSKVFPWEKRAYNA
jgi:hypothetical protein